MKRKQVILQPDCGQMIRSLVSKSNMTFTAAIRELIDNSLDAGARAIAIRYNRARRALEIEDDGRGTDNVEDVVTPYKHRETETTMSGRYGIGGSAALIFLTEARGCVYVKSKTNRFISDLVADYRKFTESPDLGADGSQEPNPGTTTGTKIRLSGVREISNREIGSAYRELALTFAPALRRGVQVAFEVDGKQHLWEAAMPPPRVVRQSFQFELDGHKIRGFCDLVRQGEPNRIKGGWAIEYGHRFVKAVADPAAERAVDLGRIYGEVVLPRAWKNINDHKDDFVDYPQELYRLIGEHSAAILDRALAEGQEIELEAATKAAQDVLDHVVGGDGPPIKGRRDKPEPGKEKPGTVIPTGAGSTHSRYSKVQPGDRPSRDLPAALSPRISINWSPSLVEQSYQVNPARNIVRVQLNPASPHMNVYRGAGSGVFLAQYAILAVIADWNSQPKNYLGLFPEDQAKDIPKMFDLMMSRIRTSKADVI